MKAGRAGAVGVRGLAQQLRAPAHSEVSHDSFASLRRPAAGETCNIGQHGFDRCWFTEHGDIGPVAQQGIMPSLSCTKQERNSSLVQALRDPLDRPGADADVEDGTADRVRGDSRKRTGEGPA